MPKPNPILEAYARKLEAEHVMKRNMLSEIDMMAAMLAAHDMLQVGPGRAAAFMHEYAMKKKGNSRSPCIRCGGKRKRRPGVPENPTRPGYCAEGNFRSRKLERGADNVSDACRFLGGVMHD